MTLKDLVRAMEIVAYNQPSVNMIVKNDIFRLNGFPDAKYGVFGWTQGQHSSSVDNSLVSYQFILYYVDRLTEDRKNEIDIQSTGVSTLRNIIQTLDDEGVFASSYSLQTFNQKFVDECAGVFATVTFQVGDSVACPESFADFSDDFNDDFMIL